MELKLRHSLGFVSSVFLILSFSVVVTEVKMLNYVVTGELVDGEHEVRMRFGDIVVREASITEKSPTRKHKLTLMLRQIASGPDFLQLIFKKYSRNGAKKTRMVECEVISDWHTANEFRNNFQRQLEKVGINVPAIPEKFSSDEPMVSESSVEDWDLDFDPEAHEPIHKDVVDLNSGLVDLRNVTVRLLRDDEIVGDMKSVFDVITQQKQCRRLHRRLKREIVAHQRVINETLKQNSRVRREVFPLGIIPGTYWCGFDKVASRRSSIGAHAGTDVCCRQHDHCPIIISAMTTQYGLFNYRMNTLSHCSCDESRSKRDISMRELGDAFRMPGTKWCGKGYTAIETRDLGGYMGADKCCRFHDLGCPHYIEAFTEKYGLFNWRMYTIMHCSCDERFRSCLKQTNTGAADFVGKLFFNIVQTKCFVLKPEMACGKRSWWGKCLKTEYKRQAHLRDPLPY